MVYYYCHCLSSFYRSYFFTMFTHCKLVGTSTFICWTSPFVILGVSGILCRFYSIFVENPITKQCSP